MKLIKKHGGDAIINNRYDNGVIIQCGYDINNGAYHIRVQIPQSLNDAENILLENKGKTSKAIEDLVKGLIKNA